MLITGSSKNEQVPSVRAYYSLINFFPSCASQSFPYLKYFSPATSINFSMKSSESRTAICAARPIRAFAVGGKAWCTSYLTRLTPDADITGYRMLCTISRYAAPERIRLQSKYYQISNRFIRYFNQKRSMKQLLKS